MELAFVSGFALTIFHNLNNKLSDMLKEKNSKSHEEAVVNDDFAKKFNQEILDHIKGESAQKFKNAINSAVTKPFITYVANGIVSTCTQSLKGLIDKRKEKRYTRNAEEIIESAKDRKLTEKEIKRANKILVKSKDPKVHAALNKLNIPMSYIALKATAIVLKKLTGIDYSIVTEYEGRKFSFDDGENSDGVKLELRLVKGHMENTQNGPGNDCVYDSIADAIHNLRNEMSPEQFRQAVAIVMLTDPGVINEIKNSNKKRYYMNISFYGGAIGPNKKTNNIESVEEYLLGQQNHLNKKVNKINENKKKGQDDHVPQFSTYPETKTRFKTGREVRVFTKGNTLVLRIPETFHAMCITTGRGDQQDKFRKKQKNLMKNGQQHEAIQESLKNYLEVAPIYHSIVFNEVAQKKFIEDKQQKAIEKNKSTLTEGEKQNIRKSVEASILSKIEKEKSDFKLKPNCDDFIQSIKNLASACIDNHTKNIYGRNQEKPMINETQNEAMKINLGLKKKNPDVEKNN